MGEFLKRNGRLVLAFVVVALFCAALPGLFRAGQAIETGSWGLSFQLDGKTPVGSASQSALERFDAVYVGDEKSSALYLTFDAGYENGNMEKILDTLKKHNAPACFFVVGNYLETAPQLVQRMVDEGHIVGNHTYHHYDMSKISDAESFKQELSDVEDLFTQITGETMKPYYRPPQGIYSEENLRLAKSLGYRTVFWSLAYVDWLQDSQPTREQAFSKLIPRIHPGAIVLLHSTSSTNAEILDELLTKWEDLGYRFESLDTLYESQPKA